MAVVAGLALGAVRAGHATVAHERRRVEVAASLGPPSRCAAEAVVVGSPTESHGTMRFVADMHDVSCEGRAIPPLRAALYGGPPELVRGDRVRLLAQLAQPERFFDPELGDPRPAASRRAVTATGSVVALERGVASWTLPALVDRGRAHVRARIHATFPARTEGLARALVLGEADLDAGDDQAFRESGLSHLLAVSGMHLVLVVVGFVRALRWALARVEPLSRAYDVGRIAAAAGAMLACAYADFAGGSGSAWRAAWMVCFGQGAIALGRAPSARRAFAGSLVVGAAVDPLVAYDVSFVLSAAATAGLLVFAGPWTRGIAGVLPPPLGRVAPALATTLAATVVCAPLLARFAPTLPLAGIVANLVAVPIGETAALPLCLLHGLCSPWPDAERGLAVVASGALSAVAGIARASASVPWLQIPVPRPTETQLAVAALALVVLKLARRASRVAWLAGCVSVALVAEVFEVRAGAPRGVLRVTFFDVGQGDAALVDLPDGTAMLVDGGGLVGSPIDTGARVVAPVLRARRRTSLAIVALSHPHPDHFGGLTAGLARVRVTEAWDTGQGEREGVAGGYASWLAAMRMQNARILRPADLCGPRRLGGALVEVLAPCPSASADRGPNDNSLVFRLSLGRRSVLFTGDAEREEEADLVAARGGLRSDVLKVGHHGSRTSSSAALVAAVRPRHAVISCGVRNRYGHPSPDALAQLGASGAHIWRTDRDGAVALVTDGDTLDVGSAVDGLPKAFYSPLP